jgi:hypothetical protein
MRYRSTDLRRCQREFSHGRWCEPENDDELEEVICGE